MAALASPTLVAALGRDMRAVSLAEAASVAKMPPRPMKRLSKRRETI
jgi:hypothetical protein